MAGVDVDIGTPASAHWRITRLEVEFDANGDGDDDAGDVGGERHAVGLDVGVVGVVQWPLESQQLPQMMTARTRRP